MSSIAQIIPTSSIAEQRNVVAAGVCRAAVEQAVLSLCRQRLAGGRSRPARRRRSSASTAATAIGGICSIATSSRCRTSGSIRGTRRGIWRFTCCRCARLDPEFAKEQLLLLLREWYMHPNGQLPAYEFALRRCESAGARLGVLARVQDDRPRAGSATGCS